MFRWLNKQGVESDEGYSLQVLDRFQLEYRDESGRSLTAKIDIGFTASMKPCIIVDQKSMRHWDKGLGSLDAGEAETIKRRIVEAMRFQDMEVDFD